VHESLAASRRWQLYLVRSLFVFGLLAGLSLAWITSDLSHQRLGNGQSMSIKELASLGQSFYLSIATVQLALVLLIAPAATAGAICMDRARGTLTHMLVTDLASSEVVLGKLAARLLPVFALVASTMPVLALAGLLGGVVIEAIVTLTVLTICLAVLGCSLALAFSVQATKTHEVLMAVYGIEAVWVLGPLVWTILASTGAFVRIPFWLTLINPFTLAWAPYAWPEQVSLGVLAAVVGGTMALSALLVTYAVLRVRAERRVGLSGRFARLWSWLGNLRRRWFAWRPGPSLDRDPVLWREWRRGRPSRLARTVWTVYIALALAGTGWGILQASGQGNMFLGLVSGLEATFGLLLLSLTAPTVLAEERVRGSLDVLMTTPVSTDRIVLAKWWGAFRVVPALALLPAIGAIWSAASAQPHPFRLGPASQSPAPLETIDRLALAILPLMIFLVQGAVVTSLGLLLATWIRRLGRAVAASVTLYALFALGWVILLEIGVELVAMFGTGLGLLQNDPGAEEFFAMILASGCPLGGQFLPSMLIELPATESRGAFYIGLIVVALVTLLLALVMLSLALVSFDRCMGRVPERPRRAPMPREQTAWIRRRHGIDVNNASALGALRS
jgi:ABC-type transport system involved in multi-copper enzyme maturation permease subunit